MIVILGVIMVVFHCQLVSFPVAAGELGFVVFDATEAGDFFEEPFGEVFDDARLAVAAVVFRQRSIGSPMVTRTRADMNSGPMTVPLYGAPSM